MNNLKDNNENNDELNFEDYWLPMWLMRGDGKIIFSFVRSDSVYGELLFEENDGDESNKDSEKELEVSLPFFLEYFILLSPVLLDSPQNQHGYDYANIVGRELVPFAANQAVIPLPKEIFMSSGFLDKSAQEFYFKQVTILEANKSLYNNKHLKFFSNIKQPDQAFFNNLGVEMPLELRPTENWISELMNQSFKKYDELSKKSDKKKTNSTSPYVVKENWQNRRKNWVSESKAEKDSLKNPKKKSNPENN